MSQHLTTTRSLLLICKEGISRTHYCSALMSVNQNVIAVSSLMDFFKRGTYRPLCGIMVDMPSYIRSSDEDKRLLTDLVGLFPSLRLKCHEPTGEIRTLPFGTVYPGNMPIHDFVGQFCHTFNPRKIRTCERSQQYLPALLGGQNGSVECKTVTANISRGGCFLVSYEPLEVGSYGWLLFTEMMDNAPVQIEVRSVRMWGEYGTLPGMGVRFLDLTPSQKNEIGRFGGNCLMLDEE